MLPFLKPKLQGVAMTITRKKDAADEVSDPMSEDDGAHAAATDLIRALKNNDEKGVADALRAAFEIFDSEPHEEYNEEEHKDGHEE